MEPRATKTLAGIYLQQGHLQEAYEIYKALAESDPFDQEVQKKVDELREKLHPSPPSKEERIRYLEKWLANIQKGRKS